MAEEAAAVHVPRSQKYNIGQFKGLVDTVENVRAKVDREREAAAAREAGLREQLKDKVHKGEKIQKELSIQLKCAGRSYQSLLEANRIMAEDLREEAERREDEVSVLKKQVKERDLIIRDAAKPWKEEIAKRELKLLKLKETNEDLKKRMKVEAEKVPPIIRKYEEAMAGKENTIEAVILEGTYLRKEIEEIHEDYKEQLKVQPLPFVAEIAELKKKIQKVTEDAEDAEAALKREIKKIEVKNVGLQKALDEVDHTPYEQKIDKLMDGFNRLRKDFEIKTQLNTESQIKMRDGYENVIEAMDKRIQQNEIECERRIRPFRAEIETRDHKIEQLQTRIQELRESEAEEREKEAAIQAELRREVKVCKEAVEMYLQQATKAKYELEAKVAELEGDGGPWKKMKMMERRLEEVTLECQALIQVKELELKDKIQTIQRLQKKVLDDAQRFDEFADMWDKRIQEKEKGYNKAIAELAFAEGQIVEERKRTAHQIELKKARERDIARLKLEHTEEIRIRMIDRRKLEEQIAELEVAIEAETGKAEPLHKKYQAIIDALHRDSDALQADLHVEIARRDRLREEVDIKLVEVLAQFEKARVDWEEKERELEVTIRARDRTILACKNELEFMNDNWEIKYARLIGLYEQLQKKYETTVGPNGANEALARAQALKAENEKLVKTIFELKDVIRQQKKRIRDLELELDQVMKDCADVIAEKERGIAEMAGDFVKLENKYRDEQTLRARLLKQKDAERNAMAESFQARVEQLEQLMEAMRFNDREELLDKIKLWQNNYKRVCVERDDLEDHYKALVDRKEEQLQGMLTENDEERARTEAAVEKGIENVAETNAKWKKLALAWTADKETLENQVQQLQKDYQKLLAQNERAAVLEGMKPKEDPAIAPLRARIKELEEQLVAVEAGKALLIAENAAMHVETQAVDAKTEDVHAIYRPQLAQKDKEMEAMLKKHEELKEVLKVEMKRAQETCASIEEQVKRFPEPFEYEINEMKDKYAQMQAGMQKMQMEQLVLENKVETTEEFYKKEIKGLEKSLDLAKHLLQEVSGLESLKHLNKSEINELEQVMGLDLDHDGRVGGRGGRR